MLRPLLRRFKTEEEGALSVETVIVFPILVWALAATFVFWDAYKARNINLKATYTVADMISREVDPIQPGYIHGMNRVFQFLIGSDDGNDLRVTVVKLGLATDGKTPEYKLEWSYGTSEALTPITDFTALRSKLPMMSVGDQLIIVESQMRWEPVFGIGLTERDMNQYVFASPRFVPQVKFEKQATTVAAINTAM